jgi:hypothetical protein
MSIVDGKIPDSPARRAHTSRIVVKFAPELRLSYSEAAEAEHADAYGHAWEALRSRFPGVTLRPFFVILDAATLENLEQRAAAAGAAPQLTSYFAIPVPHGADPAAIGQAVAAWPHVEFAYVEGGPVPPPNDPWWLTEIEGHLMLPPVNPDDDPLSANQGYLSAAPEGVDARFAWTQADGSGIGFVDLEQAWTLDHEDLPSPFLSLGLDPSCKLRNGSLTVLPCLASLQLWTTTRA